MVPLHLWKYTGFIQTTLGKQLVENKTKQILYNNIEDVNFSCTTLTKTTDYHIYQITDSKVGPTMRTTNFRKTYNVFLISQTRISPEDINRN